MNGSKNAPARRAIAVLAAAAATLAGLGARPAVATTQVTAVDGSGFGYWATNIVLFGGRQADTGPTPAASVATDASNSPQSANAASGIVAYGPARMFTSDAIAVTVTAGLGAAGSVTTTADIANINKSTTQPAETGSEPFTADRATSTCTATASGVSGGVTITNGTLVTSQDPEGNPITTEAIATNPPPNDTHEGVLSIGDRFRYVFNEQVLHPNGSLTVYAFHLYLLGPTAFGDVYVGKSHCGATVSEVNAAPSAAADSYSTPFATALTVAAPGVLGNDTDPDGDALTAALATGPANGSATLNADGSFTYTPAGGFSGGDSFTYTATDPSGASATATVAIAVGSPPPVDLAVTGSGPATVAPGGTFTDSFVVTNGSATDAAGVTLNVALTGARAGITAWSPTCTVLKGKAKGLVCNLGTIAAGATKTVTLDLSAPRRAGDTITATATSVYAGDANAANDTAVVNTTIVR